ncbi:MAG: hypothetical protein JXL84_19100 [Deltaproteobacteria bacterium]|nr:hypothetical protein [Deltaproteobacteria bacterium]
MVLLLSLQLLELDPLFAETGRMMERNGLSVFFEEPLHGLAESAAEMYPVVLEEVEGKLGLSVPLAPTLVLVRDRGMFRQMVGDRPIVAFALPQRDLVVVDCTRVGKDPFALEETLKHELCHLMLHHYVAGREIPKWLDEGLAQWVSGGLGEVLRNQKRSLLQEAIMADRVLGIRALAGRFPRSRDPLLLAYEESEDFVAYMIRHYGTEGVLNVLDRLKEGEEWTLAVEKGIGISMDALEDGWHRQLQKRRSWFMFLSNHLYEILFFVAALGSAYGFFRAYRRKRAYLREMEDDAP